MAKEQKLKEAVNRVLSQFDYADYVGKKVDNFKRGLTADERKRLKEMRFDEWLVEKGIVEVISFEEWKKSKVQGNKRRRKDLSH